MLRLADILGQTAALDWLRRAYTADRLPHGLIFAGPSGVGKASTARALATLFLCEKPHGTEPCGTCQACVLMAAGNHPDYHRVYRQLIRLSKEESKAKDLPIQVIRDFLVAPANLKSGMGRGKVFVVEEAHLMNPPAQNSMLKTLEEPAGRTLIVLITDQPDALLPTIRSRCQLLRFASLPEDLVKKELAKRQIDPALATSAATLAEGSIGLALQWIEDGVVDHATELAGTIDDLLASRPVDGLAEWFKAAGEAYAQKQLERDELASKDQATREGLALYLRLAAQMLRRKLSQSEDPDQLERICTGIDVLTRAEQYLEGNVNIPLIFQQLTVSLQRELAHR